MSIWSILNCKDRLSQENATKSISVTFKFEKKNNGVDICIWGQASSNTERHKIAALFS